MINADSASPESQKTNVREALAPKLSDKARQLLGVEKRQQKDQVFELHPELANCWKEIIAEGVEAKARKGLLEKYPNKGNCPLKAPELNPELLPLLHKTAKSRDKYLSANQDLCGRGLVAMGKSLGAIFNDEEEPIDKDTLLEWLCDASSMFCDLMFQLSKTRKFQVYQHVDEKRKSVLQESTTDDFLFGEDLGKRIKAASVVEKVGLTLKTSAEKKITARPQQFLNWKGSSVARGGQSQTSYNHFNHKPYQRFAQSNRGRYTSTQTQPKTQGRQNQPNNANNK